MPLDSPSSLAAATDDGLLDAYSRAVISVVDRVGTFIRRGGILSMAILRTIPVVPFNAVNLGLGTASSAQTGTDTLVGVENVTGSSGNDTFVASVGDGNNTYNGSAGNDTYDLSAIGWGERGDEFFYKIVDARLSFERNGDKKIAAVVLHQNGRDMHATRLDSQ